MGSHYEGGQHAQANQKETSHSTVDGRNPFCTTFQKTWNESILQRKYQLTNAWLHFVVRCPDFATIHGSWFGQHVHLNPQTTHKPWRCVAMPHCQVGILRVQVNPSEFQVLWALKIDSPTEIPTNKNNHGFISWCDFWISQPSTVGVPHEKRPSLAIG